MLAVQCRSTMGGLALFLMTGCGAYDSVKDEFENDGDSNAAVTEATVAAPPVPAPPEAEPTTAPREPEPVSQNQVPADLSGVQFLHADVSDWKVTSRLEARISGGTIVLDYDKTKVWRPVDGLNANPWIFVYRDGRWIGATWEWLRFGQTSKPTAVIRGDHIKRRPLHDFRPRSGEVYGFMVSGLARDDTRNHLERTNVVMLRWP